MSAILSWDFLAALIVLAGIFAIPVLMDPYREFARQARADQQQADDDALVAYIHALADDDPPPDATERILRRIQKESRR